MWSLDHRNHNMPIPELELARVKRALDKFCDRIPMHVRADLTNLYYRFKNNSVILIERRPYFRDPTRHTEHEFAKFVYNYVSTTEAKSRGLR